MGPAEPHALRDRFALALDFDDIVVAERLASALRPWFGVAKVGLELFCAEGALAVEAMIDQGFRVFLDLKLADIPTTVARTARVVGALGPAWLTVHAFAGPETLRAAVEGLTEGASRAGVAPPGVLAVTVLTSEPAPPPGLVAERVAAAVEAGCAGFVCAAAEVVAAKSVAPGLLAVVPGIRLPGGSLHDQARTATPAEALAAGADLLVVGRAVTAAPDPPGAAAALLAAAR